MSHEGFQPGYSGEGKTFCPYCGSKKSLFWGDDKDAFEKCAETACPYTLAGDKDQRTADREDYFPAERFNRDKIKKVFDEKTGGKKDE